MLKRFKRAARFFQMPSMPDRMACPAPKWRSTNDSTSFGRSSMRKPRLVAPGRHSPPLPLGLLALHLRAPVAALHLRRPKQNGPPKGKPKAKSRVRKSATNWWARVRRALIFSADVRTALRVHRGKRSFGRSSRSAPKVTVTRTWGRE